MSLNDNVKQELLVAFRAELEDLTTVLDMGLLLLEKGPTPEEREALLSDLFRAAHSIKGGARAVQIRDIEKIAHRLESVMGMIQSGTLTVTGEIFDLIFRAVDILREAMNAYLVGVELPRDKREKILAGLEEIINISPASEKDEAAGPAEESEQSSFPALPQRMLLVEETIRVATKKMDILMDRVGELMVARMRAEQHLNEIEAVVHRISRWRKSWRKVRGDYRLLKRQDGQEQEVARLLEFLDQNEENLKSLDVGIRALFRQSDGDYRYLGLLTDDMHEGVRRIRMLPMSTLFELYPRMVRDLARERGKEANLLIEGADIEVDRQLLDAIKDPLTHLLRNAVDHGIEKPEVREAAGKTRTGIINLRAAQKGNIISIEVADDGAGIDINAVKRAALERGVLTLQELESFNDREVLNLIYRSGFSTLREVTELSGRGVGLDVVRKNLEKLQGLVEVGTSAGQGAAFTLTLPLTLATSHVLLMGVAGQIVSVPTTTVVRILKVRAEKVGSIEGKPAIRVGGQTLSLFSLSQVLELPVAEKSFPEGTMLPVVVLGVAEKRLAFRVDDFYGAQEIVVKGMGRQFSRVRNVSGATILGDGQVVMILNVADLIKSAAKGVGMVASLPVQVKEIARHRLLVVDDSITTRTLEKNILENAGYQVTVAADGEEAWAILQSEPIDGIVADINMPRMDGFVLTKKIKGHERFKELPVVLVTSLETPQDKIRGMEAGADAYLVKSSFDQRDLLTTMERLMG